MLRTLSVDSNTQRYNYLDQRELILAVLPLIRMGRLETKALCDAMDVPVPSWNSFMISSRRAANVKGFVPANKVHDLRVKLMRDDGDRRSLIDVMQDEGLTLGLDDAMNTRPVFGTGLVGENIDEQSFLSKCRKLLMSDPVIGHLSPRAETWSETQSAATKALCKLVVELEYLRNQASIKALETAGANFVEIDVDASPEEPIDPSPADKPALVLARVLNASPARVLRMFGTLQPADFFSKDQADEAKRFVTKKYPSISEQNAPEIFVCIEELHKLIESTKSKLENKNTVSI